MFFITDANGNVVGRKKGYQTFDSAKRGAAQLKGKLWATFYTAKENGLNSNLVYSIKGV